MTSREQFETAWRAANPLHSANTFRQSPLIPGAYANARVQDGWLMWQAALILAQQLATDHAEECPSLPGRVEARLIASKLYDLEHTRGTV